jgi:guanylate kinase
MSRGSLFVIAAPSGAGKTSLVKAVLERDPSLRVSVSHTTRKPRPHEIAGEHYHFVDVDEFRRLRDAGEFLEHAQVFDNFYGTGRAQVEALRNAGHDVILEIDWQGAQQVRRAQPTPTPCSSCRHHAVRSKRACATARPTATK